MKQRLLIARALLHRPRVLLLDEPTRSLDPISAREFRAFLRSEIIERQGCTVLLATHDPEEALEFCDRIAILDHGRLIRVGSPRSLASEFRGTRYRVWTTTPEHSAFGELLHQQRIEGIHHVGRVGDLALLDINVLVDECDLADVVSFLVTRGVRLSRFERIGVGLADVIERAISVSRNAGDA
jgi:ABC-type multidrug transport system ATPase subunit